MMVRLFQNTTKKERRWVLVIIATALFLSSLPYIYGLIIAGSHHYFMGVDPVGPADTNVYFSFIKQAEQGRVFVENLHTSEPQQGSIFHPLWLVLGWVSGLFRLSIPVVFHLARIVLGAIFLLFLYRLLCSLFTDSRRRVLGLLLIAFSSGVGWPFSFGDWSNADKIFYLLPTDQWVSESNTFLTLMHSPLFILSQLLLVGTFWLLVTDATATRKPLYYGVAAALIAIIHPYDLVTLGAVGLAYVIIRHTWSTHTDRNKIFARARWQAIVAALAALVVAAYYIVAGKTQPAIGEWARQNITESSPVHNYIFGYGFILVFAVFGWVAWRKTRSPGRLMVIVWPVVSIVLLYMPIQINRRFSSGLHIPLAILATVGIDVAWQTVRDCLPQHRPVIGQAVAAACCWIFGIALFMSSAVIMAKSMMAESYTDDMTTYVTRNTIRAMDWLEQNAPRESIVMTGFIDGNLLPARTGLRVYIGHGHQTLHWEEKAKLVSGWFFKEKTSDGERKLFLQQNNIRYLLHGPEERLLGTFNPAQKSYLRLVVRAGDVAVYRVL